MAEDNIIYTFTLLSVLLGLMHLSKIVYVRLNKDKILKKYGPGTPEHDHYAEFLSRRRLLITLGLTLSFMALLVLMVNRILQFQGARTILVFGAVFSLVTCVVCLVVGLQIQTNIRKGQH